MWSLKVYGNYLIAGTVSGQLLLINKATFAIEKKLGLGTQNIRSFWIENQTLYAASQDKKLLKINLSEFEIDSTKKNTHKKIKETLEMRKEIKSPLKLSGCTHLEDNHLYISSRNILGIKVLDLKD